MFIFVIAISLSINADQLATAARNQQRAQRLVIPPSEQHFQNSYHLIALPLCRDNSAFWHQKYIGKLIAFLAALFFRQIEANMQFTQLRIGDITRGLHQQIFSLLIHRKGDHFPQILLSGQ